MLAQAQIDGVGEVPYLTIPPHQVTDFKRRMASFPIEEWLDFLIKNLDLNLKPGLVAGQVSFLC